MTDSSDGQWPNAIEEIVFSLEDETSLNSIVLSDVHPEKALSPIEVTVFGIFTVTREVHPVQAIF